ncbi:MAG: hypothetical protein A3A80_02240 [Candidatus Terrybacteria bacterium RIFCSPLOWO2_01_FULL_44_24]|uniref:peptidoglycan glycosyltransferase n=1 Tax=Candidatus Terrybacteria bacterium RIFCSPHIGHO2_01_FULL_43_35 TaxID=1802361 RepID=A0A1G2PE89_9BACT|nr:MAG: hypothetical protein A2828_02030 [Candidatus Terrybacteria bacterium RIFCSPHIGHO2_01_FULL_43_35]OHA50898.1 MAG: hypothetical protein A3A80_02240 [Candidatus Terrybacteria bacterium RIFCSPLOWO2_01_FULL_44_24]
MRKTVYLKSSRRALLFLWRRAALLVRGSVLLLIFVLIITGGIFIWAARNLPPPEAFASRRVSESTKIYDRTGTVLLYDVHGNEKRTVVPLDQIPIFVQQAFVVTEDDQFYSHIGIDIQGIGRSFIKNLTNQDIQQGGSTITQQLIRNAILTPEKTFGRKIKEIILSFEIEARYSKDEILDFYLNQIPFGSNVYGVEAASEVYLGKKVNDLSISDSAIIAALPKAPTYYSPWGSNKERLLERRDFILKRMADKNVINRDELAVALAEKPTFLPPKNNIRAPHFVFEVREQLEKQFGKDVVEEGGLKVITSIDLNLQDIAEEIVSRNAYRNEKQWRATNAALVAIDPLSGEVLTMVGSRDYFDLAHDGNVNVTTRLRQPGSSFKPIVYASAFKRGFTPNTVLFDVSTEFAASGATSYRPDNYDGAFRGPVTMRTALANSLNIPSVKTLYLAGIAESIETAKDLGITTLSDADTYGLALVLGGAEVKLLEETSAFGVFATEGMKASPAIILRIEDNRGNTLFDYKPRPVRVLDQQIARNITDILSDNQARSLVFGLSTPLILGDRPVAAKTGTTQDFRDGWTVGYTPSLVAGVWVGNNDNTPMKKGADGVVVAAPIWNDFMTKALKNKSTESFNRPDPIITGKPILDGNFVVETPVRIDRVSEKRATSATPLEFVEERLFREVHSILFWVDKNDPQDNTPKSPSDDPQYDNWETAVQNWVAANKNALGVLGPPPNDFDDTHTQERAPKISFLTPKENSSVASYQRLPVEISVDAPFGINQVLVLTDGSVVGRLFESSLGTTLKGSFYPQWKKDDITPGDFQEKEHLVTVRAFDRVGNVGETTISVYLQ